MRSLTLSLLDGSCSMCLSVVNAAACRLKCYPPFPRNSSFDILCVLLASTVYSTDPFGFAIPMQPTGLKSDDVSLGIPPARLGLGRDMVPLVIFRTLSPICILSVVGRYSLPLFFWIFVL